GGCQHVPMTRTATLEVAITHLREIVSADGGDRDDAEACAWAAAVEEAGRLVDALRVTAAADLAHRSRPELGEASVARRHGCRTAAQLLERLTRVSARETTRRVKLGARVAARAALDGAPLPAEHPLVAAALAEGAI